MENKNLLITWHSNCTKHAKNKGDVSKDTKNRASIDINKILINRIYAGPIGRAVQGIGLRPLASWDCGFESSRRHGYFSDMCCKVEGSETG